MWTLPKWLPLLIILLKVIKCNSTLFFTQQYILQNCCGTLSATSKRRQIPSNPEKWQQPRSLWRYLLKQNKGVGVPDPCGSLQAMDILCSVKTWFQWKFFLWNYFRNPPGLYTYLHLFATRLLWHLIISGYSFIGMWLTPLVRNCHPP